MTTQADKAYSNRKIRTYLRQRRIKATIPEKTDQQQTRAAKGTQGGQPPAFDPEVYKQRNTVRGTRSCPGGRAPDHQVKAQADFWNPTGSSPEPLTTAHARARSASTGHLLIRGCSMSCCRPRAM
jgi:hypothetical protein